MRIVFLGTAGSWPTKERNASSLAIETDRELLLFDCGEGTQRQLFSSSCSFMKVRRVFISHYHGDHFLGLPGLIQSMCLNHREEPLDIYGPAETPEVVAQVLDLGYFTLRFPVTPHALAPGESVELPGATVRTALAEHPVPTLAFRLEEGQKRGRFDGEKARSLGVRGTDFSRLVAGESITIAGRVVRPDEVMGPPRPGRSIVYSGDTAPSEEVLRLSQRATVLVHEATTGAELETEANQWGHSSARQAAELARSAEVGELFLTHFSARYESLEPLEMEARDKFLASRVARDLLDHVVRQP